MRFGMIRCSRSVAETATSVRQKKAATKSGAAESELPEGGGEEEPSDELDRRVADGMCTPQARQRPRRSAYERIGTLSYHAISCPQSMQAEPGLTRERRSGTRAATTFRKEPRARPGARASAAIPIPLSLSAEVGLRLSCPC